MDEFVCGVVTESYNGTSLGTHHLLATLESFTAEKLNPVPVEVDRGRVREDQVLPQLDSGRRRDQEDTVIVFNHPLNPRCHDPRIIRRVGIDRWSLNPNLARRTLRAGWPERR